MSIEAITAERYRETTTSFGASPDRDAAILHAAMGGMLLVSLEPAIARIATRPAATDPASIDLFNPPRSRRRIRHDKPLSDLGLARYDQPLIVNGLALDMKDMLRDPERLHRRGFIAYVPEVSHSEEPQRATTRVLAIAKRPLDPDMIVYRHTLALECARQAILHVGSPIEAATTVQTEEVIADKTAVVYRALSRIIELLQHTQPHSGKYISPAQKEELPYIRPLRTNPWTSLSRQRRRNRK